MFMNDEKAFLSVASCFDDATSTGAWSSVWENMYETTQSEHAVVLSLLFFSCFALLKHYHI
jgi:hypothetical protein